MRIFVRVPRYVCGALLYIGGKGGMRHFPPVLLAAGCVTWDPWVLVGAGMKYDPPPSLKGVHAGGLDNNNNNNNNSRGGTGGT